MYGLVVGLEQPWYSCCNWTVSEEKSIPWSRLAVWSLLFEQRAFRLFFMVDCIVHRELAVNVNLSQCPS